MFSKIFGFKNRSENDLLGISGLLMGVFFRFHYFQIIKEKQRDPS